MCREKLKRKDFQKTLEESPSYQDEQAWKLDAGQNIPVPNSTKCDKDMKSKFLCLCVSGVLSAAYQTEKAVLQKYFFVAWRLAFMQGHPGQTKSYWYI